MAVYVTAEEFLKRYDARDIGDLVSDNNQQIDYLQLLSDDKLSMALGDASGDIDAALLVGGRYKPADLENLTGNALSTLQRTASDLAMYYLLSRRPEFNPERLEAYEKLRNRHLKRLQSGENVFNLDKSVAAGHAHVDGPSTQDYDDLNLVRDRTRNYFPARRLPGNR